MRAHGSGPFLNLPFLRLVVLPVRPAPPTKGDSTLSPNACLLSVRGRKLQTQTQNAKLVRHDAPLNAVAMLSTCLTTRQ